MIRSNGLLTEDNQQLQSVQRKLLPHHRKHLQASGLSDATIEAAGIYSETNAERLGESLNWGGPAKKLVPALVIPFLGDDGPTGYSRIRPDNPRQQGGKPVKYESPRGRPNEIYLPPEIHRSLADPGIELLITEGEKKALAAQQHGFCCLGLVGVWGWKPAKEERLLPALEGIAWRGRRVWIVFDSDIVRKPDVQNAESRLARALIHRGADVRVVRLPDGQPDLEGRLPKMGLDDFLLAHGRDELRKLLEAAAPPPAPAAIITKVPARTLDPNTVVADFLERQTQDGVSRLQSWQGKYFWWQNGGYVEWSLQQVQAALIRHLNGMATHLSTATIGNHMAQLQAQTALPEDLQRPAWIGQHAPPWSTNEILACRNVLVHLPSLVEERPDYSMPATPRYFNTSVLNYDFDLQAQKPTNWIKFLEETWPNDPASIDLLQEWFGYCLTPDTSQQKILLLIGPPRSGKGTIARVLRQLVGRDNYAGPTSAGLTQNFGLMDLQSKTVAVIPDARLGHPNNSAVIERLLSISGEDTLTIDRKHRGHVNVQLQTRLVLLTNELPRLTDSSGALASRMLMLQLRRGRLGREDPQLTSRLLTEIAGILLWAIEGWRRLRERGRFDESGTGTAELRQQLEELSSPLQAFIRDRCVTGEGREVSRDALYAAYRAWCTESGKQYIEDAAGFGRNLRAALPTLTDRNHRVEGRQQRFYVGIAPLPPGA